MTDKNIDIFSDIGKKIAFFLHSNPNKDFTLREIHNELFEKFDLKNPSEKEDFKNKVEIVLRSLPSSSDSRYKQIYVRIDNNGNLITSFSKDEPNDINNNLSFSENDKNIINFIVDENLKNYFNKDFKGNNILHYLIYYNDYIRLKKIYKLYDHLLMEENKEGLTPLEMIKDEKISSLFIHDLMVQNTDNEYEILNLNDKNKDLVYELRLTQIFVFILFAYQIISNLN
jgi:hypothetical protein